MGCLILLGLELEIIQNSKMFMPFLEVRGLHFIDHMHFNTQAHTNVTPTKMQLSSATPLSQPLAVLSCDCSRNTFTGIILRAGTTSSLLQSSVFNCD